MALLAGIKRLLHDEGLTIREERYSIDQWRRDAESGHLLETMACGTAAVVTPVGKVEGPEGAFTIGSGGPGQFAEVRLLLEPLPRGEGIRFESRIVGGAVPREFIPAVEAGIRRAALAGVVAGLVAQMLVAVGKQR